jgi:hypothetical protein
MEGHELRTAVPQSLGRELIFTELHSLESDGQEAMKLVIGKIHVLENTAKDAPA